MIFNKDNFIFGAILGMLAPVAGLLILKNLNLSSYSYKNAFLCMLYEPGFKVLSAGLSVSLMMNALFFTIYINRRKDNTAKGIFVTTLIYGLIILSIKTFS